MNTTPKTCIAHYDLDSFFVSVEILNNPSLKGKPVIVGGTNGKGVVSTCSYEARKKGVSSAMPMQTAMRLCPEAIIVQGTRGEYSKYSRWVTDIIAARAPLFEKASIDEFYIDLTGMSPYHNAYQWAIDLRETIITQTGLPISFGMGINKMVAKIATSEAKPNGYLYIETGREQDFLAPLSVGKIPGVGEQTLSVLQSLGITTIGDVNKQNPAVLTRHLGKYGGILYEKSLGKSGSTLAPYHEAKSVSTECTFDEPVLDATFLLSQLVAMVEKVAFEMRQQNKLAGCITVKIRYPDFVTKSKQIAIDYSSADDELIPIALHLFQNLYNQKSPIRLLGVGLGEFVSNHYQGNLFSNQEKKSKLYQAIDVVKLQYGKHLLTKARTINGIKRSFQ